MDLEKWRPVLEKVMFKQKAKATWRIPLHFSGAANDSTRCAACRFFVGAPAALESALPGVNILSSAYGSVRDDTGLCGRHGLFTTARTAACPRFEQAES